jgi:hypothetical protein
MSGAFRNSSAVVFLFSGFISTLSGVSRAEVRDADDVVIDNREGDPSSPVYDSDTPFADAAPDPVAKRAERWKPTIGGSIGAGYAVPTGLSGLKGSPFVVGDLGYWFTPHLFLGAKVSGGYVLQKCDGYDSCSGWNLHAGPELVGRLLPFQNITPWLGVGAGMEFLWLNQSTDAFSASTTASGFDLLDLRVGVDLRKNDQLLGVFASYSVSRYSTVSSRLENAAGEEIASGSGDTAKGHGWFSVGVRGSLD